MNFTVGQSVFYKNKQTHIEQIYKDGTCMIANPDWDWDEEGLCVDNDLEYDIPYWITVNISELKV